MVQVSYPGVCIQVGGVRTITEVTASITAFNDGFAHGLRDDTVQLLEVLSSELLACLCHGKPGRRRRHAEWLPHHYELTRPIGLQVRARRRGKSVCGTVCRIGTKVLTKGTSSAVKRGST